ncbi:MAG: hypothetical protein PHW75_01445 [Patescibacteria group bacterium]|nr:hypothetical protein [Patescibacteria group bacterium]
MPLPVECSGREVVAAILEEKDRNTDQAAEWLTALGYVLTKNQLARIVDRGRVRGLNSHGTGKIWPHELLMKEAGHPSSWLKEVKRRKLPKGLVTVRRAVADFPGSLSRLLGELAAGDLNCSTVQQGSVAVLAIDSKELKALRHVDEADVSSQKETKPPTPTPGKELKVSTPASGQSGPVRQDQLVSLKEATMLLQEAKLDVMDNQLRALAKKKVFVTAKLGRTPQVRHSEVQRWINEKPEWLLNCAISSNAPEGFVTTRQIVVEGAFDYDRLKNLIKHGLLPATQEKKAKGVRMFVSEEDYLELLGDDKLVAYLKLELDLEPAQLKAMARRRKPAGSQTSVKASARPKVASLTFEQCSAAYFEAKRFLVVIEEKRSRAENLVERFDEAIAEGKTNQEIVELVSDFVE